MKTEIATTVIYDARRSLRFNPVILLFNLVLGLLLSIWYLRGITDAVKGDIRYFPAAYQASPPLAVTFAILKTVAYPSFGLLFAAMIYAPVRNIWLTRIVNGPLEKVSANSYGNKARLFLKVGGRTVTLRDPGDLKPELDRHAVLGDELRVTVGAFGWPAKVERLARNTE